MSLAVTASAQQQPGDLHTLIKKPEGEVEFGIITNKGYVSFTANSEWKTVEMKTKPPVTTTVFQIPNSADEGTSDSSSFVVMSFEQGVPNAKSELEFAIGSATADSKRSDYGKWSLFIASGLQGKTPYQVRTAVREFQGETILVRAEWPQLPKNAEKYDELMDAVFRALLDSVKCGLGPKPVRNGEVLRRPTDGANSTT